MWTVVAIVSGYAGFMLGMLVGALCATAQRCDDQADAMLRDLGHDLRRLERELR